MTKDIARGLLMLEKTYEVILVSALGDLYEEILDEAEDGIESGRLEIVPFLDIEYARDYIYDLNEYYESTEKPDKS